MERRALKWISGTVERGDGRGRELGFPTANLRLMYESERPEDGIYAGWATLDTSKEQLKAVIHVGPRPTIPGATPSVEVHLLSADHINLYGHTLSFATLQRLRDVAKFDSLEELSAAIQEDCRHALKILEDHSVLL